MLTQDCPGLEAWVNSRSPYARPILSLGPRTSGCLKKKKCSFFPLAHLCMAVSQSSTFNRPIAFQLGKKLLFRVGCVWMYIRHDRFSFTIFLSFFLWIFSPSTPSHSLLCVKDSSIVFLRGSIVSYLPKRFKNESLMVEGLQGCDKGVDCTSFERWARTFCWLFLSLWHTHALLFSRAALCLYSTVERMPRNQGSRTPQYGNGN